VSFWDHRFTAFTFGFFGGLSINLILLHLISRSPAAERPDFDWIYWTQFLGLALMGGIAALAHDLSNPITPWVALNVGLSIPALLKTAAELQGPKKQRKTN
jgi:hypothetical protein